MKNFFKLVLTLFWVMQIHILVAQDGFSDSMHVQIDDEIEFELAVNGYKDLSSMIEKDLKHLQSILKETDQIPNDLPFSITYTPDKKVSIFPAEQTERIIWEGDKPANRLSYKNKCTILSNRYFLLIRYNDLDDLQSDSLLIKIKEVVSSTAGIESRFAKTYHYSFQNGNLIHESHFDQRTGTPDMISFNFGLGANLIKSQPVVDLFFELGIQPGNKGYFNPGFYLSYDHFYHYNSEFNLEHNGFLNIGMKNAKGGVEFGYLTLRQGDFFDKNTFKIGSSWDLTKFFTVEYQIFFAGKKDVHPAIRIGFNFF